LGAGLGVCKGGEAGEASGRKVGSHNGVYSIYQYAKSKDSEVFKKDIKLEPIIVYNVRRL
jgi:hypothetical protein